MRKTLALLSLSALLPAALNAQPARKTLEDFQLDRVFYNALSDRACTGDEEAYDTLYEAAIHDNKAPAKTALRWLIRTEACDTHDPDLLYMANALMVGAALQDYPVAQSNLAESLYKGLDGLPTNRRDAARLYRNAILGGYPEAASHYVRNLLNEPLTEPSHARILSVLDMAGAAGLAPETLQTLTEALERKRAGRDLEVPQQIRRVEESFWRGELD